MRFNFRQIAAVGSSLLMVGMTAGLAAAANYPAPFVSGGNADVAIVYGTGTGVSALDVVQAGNIQSSLQTFMSGGTTGGSASTSGEVVSLDTNADRIWLNTSLNSVKSTITKSDLPTVLGDFSFSGDVTSKVTSAIKLQSGANAGGDNSGKVIFTKQPSSSDDPVIGISLGASATSNPLYNASATMSAINFTHADSEGEDITLFGQSFTIASETDTTSIVLLKDAAKVDLTSDAPSASVDVGGSQYTIELVSASDTSATIKVTDSSGNSDSKEINEAASKRVNGIDVAVTNADETNLKLSATVTAGADKLTLTNGAIVTVGEDDDPIDGTLAYIIGGTGATTEIAVAVFRPDSTSDAILPGTSFMDPVFGSFKLDFAGLSSPLDDTTRSMVSVGVAGDDTMTLKFTEQDGNEKSIDFAHNESTTWRLADDSNFSYGVREMANLSYNSGGRKYIVLGNEDYGHLLELYDVYNQTTGSSSITNDRVKFKDVFTGETYESTFSSTEGSGTIDVDGKRYTVTFANTGETASVQIKYPTSDSANANTYVVFPTIETSAGALVQILEPTTINLSNPGNGAPVAASVLQFPDGDGYTSATFTYAGIAGGYANWTVTGAGAGLISNFSGNSTLLTVGTMAYNLTTSTTENITTITADDPEGAARIDNPAIVVFEPKDDNSEYHAVVVDLETTPVGNSDNGVGVNDVLFTSDYYHAAATLASDSDITQDVDWFGTLTTTDAAESDQKVIDVSIPKGQVYAQLFVGASGAVVTPGGSSGGTGPLGDILVKDSEVSSVGSKNLVVVGGSCINSVAAGLVGGALCGSAWTDATSVGSGQFLIQSFARDSKVALLVAGYDASDTVNAATYLRTKTVDTSVGKKYIGTSSTSAELQVA
jgi:hypothetical protein